VKIFNICSKKTYQKDGVEKAIWLICGTMRELENGNRFIEINHLPGTSFYVFDQKKKDDAPKQEKSNENWDQ
jgi:hypothetical protein